MHISKHSHSCRLAIRGTLLLGTFSILLVFIALTFKANMNSYIQLQTAAIFFLSSLCLKQGIDWVYVMVGFICKGLLEV